MKIKGSVPSDEVPEASGTRQRGMWQELANAALAEHRRGKTLTVELADREEYHKLRNSTSNYWRHFDVWVNPTLIDQPDGTVLLYLKLEDRNPPPVSLGRPRGRPRKSG